MDGGSSQAYRKDLSNMKSKIITVADLVKFLKMLPPDTKIRVKEEITRHYDTYTEFVEVVQYDGDYNPIHIHTAQISATFYLKIPKYLPSKKQHQEHSNDGCCRRS